MGNAWSRQGLDLECPTSFLETTSRVTSVRAKRFMPLVYMTQLIPVELAVSAHNHANGTQAILQDSSTATL